MPRTLLHAPGHDRYRSLGWLGVSWIEHMVRHGPGAVQGQKISHGDEFTAFIVDCYALSDGRQALPGMTITPAGRMLYDWAFFSRSKGCNKSGLAAELVLFEAFGPCRFAGWAKGGERYQDPWGLGFSYTYEAGEPMGRPVGAPFVRVMATEEHQAGNVYRTVYYNLTDDECPLFWVPGKEAGLEKVLLPYGGEIRPSTASSAAKDGGIETFVVFDESHIFNTNELREMYNTVVRNLVKGKNQRDTWFIETTTMFAPGENSIAEGTYTEAEALKEGRKKRGRHRLLYDHRWGECEDLSDEDTLRKAIIEAYGEAIEWNSVEAIIDEFYSTRADPQKSRRYFLNAQTSMSDSWIAAHEWAACKAPGKAIALGELVCLGMDGSVNEDATCISMINMAGHIELIGCWEKPEGAQGDGWQVDRDAVDAVIAQAMNDYEVAGLFCDPAHWMDTLSRWTAEYGEVMRVKATERHPLEWWTNRPKAMVSALERFHEAVLEKRVTYTPEEELAGEKKALASALTRHVLNARRRPSRAGLQIAKEHPQSKRKIDGAMASVLAYDAVGQAIAKGVQPRAEANYPAKRIR
jgi:hypothetical protein